jgi:hypothetical protein
VEIDSVLSVVNASDEIIFESLLAAQLLKALADWHFENIVGFLYLTDVHFLQLYKLLVKNFTYICHLQEPIQNHFLLV